MSNPDMPGPYWQDPAGADYGSVGYGGTARGGAAYGGRYTGSRRSGAGGASRDGADSARQPRGSGQDGYPVGGDRASQSPGRANGWDAAVPGSSGARGGEDPWDVQRGRGSRRARPAPGADRGPQGPRGDRGYPAGQRSGSGQLAQDLRDRLGVSGSRNGRGAAAAGPAARPGRAGGNGAATDGAGYSGAGYSGAGHDGAGYNGADRGAPANGTGLSSAARNGAAGRNGQEYGPRGGHRADVGYADDSYGRTVQRGRPGRAGDWRGDDDPRTAGRGQPGHGNGGRGRGRGGGPGGPGRSGGGRRSIREWFLSGDWWRRWTWKKALGVFAAILVGVPVLLLVAFFVAYEQTSLPTATTATATAAPSQVYFSNHHLIAAFSNGGLNRQILAPEQIPAVMTSAVIAAEDRHFYTEGGISPTGILRAAYENIKGGAVSQGGSTLTEQLVKNYYAGFATAYNTTGSASVKFKQILVAIKLAHTKSKSWILTEYLNTVYFGQNAYGVGAAAQTYFNESASSLNVSQAAMLAAMVNEPGYFSPDPHAGAAYTDLVARWHYVLTNMVRDGALTPAQSAKEAFPKVHYHLSSSLDGYKGYLMQMVDQELTRTYHLSQPQIDTGGLKIYTTFRQSMMNALYRAVAANKAQMAADGHALPPYAYVGAVLERPTDGSILAVYGGPGYTSNIKKCQREDCDLNMAENAKQVGSSFKPYVLATAVSEGMNAQSSKLNGASPLWIPEGQTPADQSVLSSRTKPTGLQLGQQPWVEFNEPSEASNKAPLTPSVAAAISSDPAFEDLAHHVGVQSVINLARQFGVGATPFTQSDTNDWAAMNAQYGNDSKVAPGAVNIALGESDLTAVEQASTFATLANDGVYHTPHVIAKIVEGGGAVPLQIESRQVLTAAQAADVDYALSFDNIPGGTAYPNAAWPGQSVIGKTGTTQTAQDAWFIGAIPGYSLGVTLFTNEQDSSLRPGAQTLDVLPVLPGGNPLGGYGGEWPAAIWHTFMLSEFANMAPQALPTPNFTGFGAWDEWGATPTASPSPSASATPSAQPTPTCSPQPGFACVPGGGLSPSPPATTPSPPATTPSPSCTPQQFGQPCQSGTPPIQPGNATVARTQPAEETTAALRLLRSAAAG